MSLTDRAKLCTHLCAKNSLRRLALAKDYLPSKFQVRSFIRFKDIESCQKIRKRVTEMTFKRHSRSSGMTQFYRAPMIDFLLAFHSNYGPISHCFRDTMRYCLKVANVWYVPHFYLAPPLGVTTSEFNSRVSFGKTSIMGLPGDEKI